jgi:putative endopeptidase
MTENHGIKPEYMDPSASPGVDFNQYANGGYLRTAVIPPGFPRWGAFDILAQKNREQLKTLVDAASARSDWPAGSPEQLVGDFYASAMDEAGIESLGLSEVKPYLDAIAGIKTRRQFAAVLSSMHRIGLPGLFAFGSSPDFDDSTQVIAHFVSGGTGLGDRDYYLETDEKAVDRRAKYVTHITNMLVLLGERKHDAKRHAEEILAFETQLATGQMKKEDRRNPNNRKNKMSLAAFEALFTGFPVAKYLDTIGCPKIESLNVMDLGFYKAMPVALAGAKLSTLKAYLRWNVLRSTASLLPKAFADEAFSFYGTVMTGVKEQKPRWMRMIGLTDSNVGEALGAMYVARFFPPEAKARMMELIDNLKEAFRDSLTKRVDWMSEETRRNALKKLDSFEAKIGYPDEFETYDGLVIDRKSILANSLRCSEFEQRKDLGKIGNPVDRGEWGMTPQTVNAYYSPQLNQIVFPAGILQAPFFDFEADDAANYGGIAVVIGHEMTHGFDDSGARFDAAGNLNMWWTDADFAEFLKRTQLIIDQFGEFVSESGRKLNGKNVSGEAGADLGGINLAYAALQKALVKSGRKTINGFTDEQRYFLGFAQLWAIVMTPEYADQQALSDPHPAGKFRVNGTLAHVPEFAAAFGMTEDNCPLLLPADKRCQLW